MPISIKLHAGGKLQHAAKQQIWRSDKPEVMQTATFSGQQMVAITDDAGAFDLTYLGFETKGFESMDSAKAAAPTFARQVLNHLSELVTD
jgi:hypothetical protein